METVSARRAIALCGFGTVAMLDYLERTGVFVRRNTPKVRGKRRQYTFRDLVVLRVLNSLLKSGASVDALKKSLVQFQLDKWKADKGTLEMDSKGLKYLMVSAGNVIYAQSNDRGC